MAIAFTALVAIGVTSLPASASPRGSALEPAYQDLGTWTQFSFTGGAPGSTPAVYESPSYDAYDLWVATTHSKYTYYVAQIGPDGGIVAPPQSIFGASWWDGLSFQTTLVGDGGKPLVIFAGIRSSVAKTKYDHDCVYGALGPGSSWSLQSWVLSQDCYNPDVEATETSTGGLSAAWPASWPTKKAIQNGVKYRIGVSAHFPPLTPDSMVADEGNGTVYQVNEAADVAGKDDVYVAWTVSNAHVSGLDGFYAKDVSSNGPSLRAPASGAGSVNFFPLGGKVPMAATNTHAGVFLLYCANGPYCTGLRLWRVGLPTAMTVPGSANSSDYALSAGPDGRLWLAWYNHSNNDVSTVRTNMADTAFGPVETYKTPCFEDGYLGLSGGSWGRLDVAMQCVESKTLKAAEYVTQSLTALAISPTARTVSNAAAQSITYHVTDAGDPVAGATVHQSPFTGKTDASGNVTFSLPKGYRPGGGTVTVTANADNYIPASGTLVVTS